MFRILDVIIYWIQWVLIIGTVMALIAPFVHPVVSTVPAIFNLGFPVMILAHVILIIYWIFRKKLRFIPSLIVIALSWTGLKKSVALNLADTPTEIDSTVKIMTYNVKGFGRFEEEIVGPGMIQLIDKESPDILCVQEFYSRRKTTSDNLAYIRDSLNYRHLHFDSSVYGHSDKLLGMGIFSSFPVIRKGKLDFEMTDFNGGMFADLRVGDDTVRIMNVHLQSVRLYTKPGDYAFIPEMESGWIDRVQSKFTKLNDAFIKRARQVEKVKGFIKLSPYKVILCGDFNDTPLSYTYSEVTSQLNDAYLEGGNGIGITYAGKLPMLRIDYIMTDPSMIEKDCYVIKHKLSDHYPVVCSLSL